MQQFWLSLLQTIARALRVSAGLWERAAQAIDRRLPEEREPEPPGSTPPGSELPGQWLAAVERREPPAQWLELVRQRAPEVRFQHYRAASAPPSPALRSGPATAPRVAPAGDHAPAPPDPARAVVLGVAPAGLAALAGAPSPGASQREGTLAGRSGSQPEDEPDAQSGAAAESVFVAAPSPPPQWQAPTYSEAAGVEPGQLPDHLAESQPGAVARFLSRARLFLSGQATSAPDGESPAGPGWPRDRVPHSGPWPTPEPPGEDASVTTQAEPVSSPWPALPGEAMPGRAASTSAPWAGPGAPSVDRLFPVDAWPSLPRTPYGAGEGTPAADEPEVDERALRRRQRLDDEQRGVLWNGSIY